MKPTPKYILEYEIELQGMTNEELLNEVSSQARGDDWDGMFTSRGEALYNATWGELRKRLLEIGFLSKDTA